MHQELTIVEGILTVDNDENLPCFKYSLDGEPYGMFDVRAGWITRLGEEDGMPENDAKQHFLRSL